MHNAVMQARCRVRKVVLNDKVTRQMRRTLQQSRAVFTDDCPLSRRNLIHLSLWISTVPPAEARDSQQEGGQEVFVDGSVRIIATNNGPTVFPSISAAVKDAQDGAVVLVAAGR